MKLSIVTINYNDAKGLAKTLASVASQTNMKTNTKTECEVEHIIIDGGSADGGVDIIKDYLLKIEDCSLKIEVKWVSERDKGIYNAMNKGIKMASGDYCQFLNSGDCLLNEYVIEKMVQALVDINSHRNEPIGVMYGNMKKVLPSGKILHDACGGGTREVTYDMFYHGCLNHSPAYIRRELFDKYGLYDETLKICSDWKFYMQSLILGGESVQYVDIDVTLFDMTGISERNKKLLNEERDRLNKELIPPGVLRDYELYHFPMEQYRRMKHYHLWSIVYFVERVLFKLEKWHILR